MSDPPFLARTIHGRAAAMSRVDDLLAEGGVLALLGDAGIGKTRLARWAAERADHRRATVVEGAAILGMAEPLGVMRDLVRFTRRTGREPPMRDPLAVGLPAQLLPELGGDAGGGGNLGATFEAAARYIDALADRRGALVVLEDLHWADATSLSLVPFLARTARAPGLALLLTYRVGEQDTTPALEGLRAELRRSRLADEVLLEPLDPADAAAMLTEVLGRSPSPDVGQELLRLAGGNPFALEELARAAVESGWLDPETGRRRGAGAVAVPWTLAESIRARAAALPEPERELIAWAAAAGSPFDARLLARAADRPLDEILSGLAVLVGAGFLAEAGDDHFGMAFAFRHMLVHEALSREGLAAERRKVHARILDAAEELAAAGELAPSPAELARHAMAAGDRRRTMAHSREAVAEAQELGAVEEAVQHLERALSLWTDADGRELRAQLLFATGRLRARLARGDERAVDLLAEAVAAYAEIGDELAELWCLGVLADARYETGDRELAAHDWERAIPGLRRLGHREALRTALVGYSRHLALVGRPEAAATAAQEGLALAADPRNAVEVAERANLLINQGIADRYRYRTRETRAAILEAIALAMAHHDDVTAARGHHILAAAHALLRPVDELLGHFAAASELVERHGLTTLRAFYASQSGFLLAAAGRWDAAERFVDEGAALVEGLERADWIRWQVAEVRMAVLVGRGDLERGRTMGDELARHAFSAESVEHDQAIRTAHARTLLLLGEREASLDLVDPLRRLVADDGDDVLSMDSAIALVEVLAIAGAREEAAAYAAALRAQLDCPWFDYCVAMAGDDDPAGAATVVAEAATAGEADGWAWEGARMRIVAAMVLGRREDGRPAAIELVRGARERLAALGAEAWTRRLEAMLRSWGERAPTRGGAGAGGLSARELEVLALVAEGLTNRQIAERLVVSPHTAVRHVANLMAKLGAPSRAAAVKVAAERGLLSG